MKGKYLMLLLIAGALSLALWIKFVAKSPGRHVTVNSAPGGIMVLWFMFSLVAIFGGWIWIAVG